MTTTAGNGNVTGVIKFLEEAADYGDSISPGFAHRYRAAAEALKYRNPSLADGLLEEEERHAVSEAARWQRQLARIRALRQQLNA